MPIPIRPDGLFHGERLHRCSHTARWWFPYFFLGSNNVGRIRIHYADMLRTCFSGFQPPPSSAEMMDLFHEYQRNFLIFLYRDKITGEIWGQWDTAENARFSAHDAAKSPPPPQAQFEGWRAEYRTVKNAAHSATTLPVNNSQSLTVTHGESPSDTERHSDALSAEVLTVNHQEERRGEERRLEEIKQGFSIPDWIPQELWEGFEEMRKKIRKPLTNKARALTIRELERLQAEGNPPSAVLEQSIQNAWQGVFPLRTNQRPGAHASKQPQHGTSRDASSIADDRRKARESNATAKS